MKTAGWRTGLIWVGSIIFYGLRFMPTDTIGLLILYWLILLTGMGLVLYGCYIWTKLKCRHWAFMFWGLASPIGLLGIGLLKDKSFPVVSPNDVSADSNESNKES